MLFGIYVTSYQSTKKTADGISSSLDLFLVPTLKHKLFLRVDFLKMFTNEIHLYEDKENIFSQMHKLNADQ